MDWIWYNSEDFRYYIGVALIDIKNKILDLQNGKILDLKNAKKACKYDDFNVNTKTSKMIVK
jgi:hypothetical protein